MHDLSVLWRLCCFRAWANDFNPRLFVLGVFLTLGWLIKSFLMGVSLPSIMLSSLSYFWLAAFVFGTLRIAGHESRFVQTYIAVCAVVLAQMLCICLILSFNIGNVIAENLVVLLWSLAAFSHVMRDALDTSVTKAVALVVAFEALRYLFLSELAIRWLPLH